MSSEKKIDYIESPSNDLKKTKAFFSEVFGWKFQDYGPEYAAYDDGRTRGGFYISDKTSLTEQGGTLVVLYSEKLEETLARVKAAGGCVLKDIFSFPGGRRFQFSEPGGSEFAVWSDK